MISVRESFSSPSGHPEVGPTVIRVSLGQTSLPSGGTALAPEFRLMASSSDQVRPESQSDRPPGAPDREGAQGYSCSCHRFEDSIQGRNPRQPLVSRQLGMQVAGDDKLIGAVSQRQHSPPLRAAPSSDSRDADETTAPPRRFRQAARNPLSKCTVPECMLSQLSSALRKAVDGCDSVTAEPQLLQARHVVQAGNAPQPVGAELQQPQVQEAAHAQNLDMVSNLGFTRV